MLKIAGEILARYVHSSILNTIVKIFLFPPCYLQALFEGVDGRISLGELIEHIGLCKSFFVTLNDFSEKGSFCTTAPTHFLFILKLFSKV